MDKNLICMLYGVISAFFYQIFGIMDNPLITLLIFMAIDYFTGFLVGWYGKSKKTKTGKLNSAVGFKGIAKKVMMLCLVALAFRCDLLLGVNYIRIGTIYAFIANEGISIIENAIALDIPIPKPIVKAIEIIKDNGGNDDEKDKK